MATKYRACQSIGVSMKWKLISAIFFLFRLFLIRNCTETEMLSRCGLSDNESYPEVSDHSWTHWYNIDDPKDDGNDIETASSLWQVRPFDLQTVAISSVMCQSQFSLCKTQ